jgi:hypothetical protein
MEGDVHGDEGAVPGETKRTEEGPPPVVQAAGREETQSSVEVNGQDAGAEDDLAQDPDDEMDVDALGEPSLPLKAMVESLLFVAD